MPDDDIFSRFPCWSGTAPAGFVVESFLGVLQRPEFVAGTPPAPEARQIATQRPDPKIEKEDYLEWIDLLEAVAEARGCFTMIELGAGYGRWTARAAAAVRTLHGPDMPYRLVAVEAEPTHFRWMTEHFRNNGIDPARVECRRAAVAAQDGHVWFFDGAADDWYGQTIAPAPGWREWLSTSVKRLLGKRFGRKQSRVKVPAVSLNALLEPLDRVDLLDLDVQGAEFEVLDAAADRLGKIRRVHVGTHNAGVEDGIRRLFTRLGWRNTRDYACGKKLATPYGEVDFQDGIQTWINDRV
jgi:FkbM family methyltransferase